MTNTVKLEAVMRFENLINPTAPVDTPGHGKVAVDDYKPDQELSKRRRRRRRRRMRRRRKRGRRRGKAVLPIKVASTLNSDVSEFHFASLLLF